MNIQISLQVAIIVVILDICTSKKHKIAENLAHCLSKPSKPTNICILDTIRLGLTYAKTGIPQYHIDRFDPMIINRMQVQVELLEDANVNATFTNTQMRGLLNLNITRVDINKNEFTFHAYAKHVSSTGQNEFSGDGLGLHLEGKGSYFLVVKGLHVAYTSYLTYAKGDHYPQVTSYELGVTADEGRMRLNGITGGIEFANAVNEHINKNFVTLFSQVSPQIKHGFAALINGIYNSAIRDIAPDFDRHFFESRIERGN